MTRILGSSRSAIVASRRVRRSYPGRRHPRPHPPSRPSHRAQGAFTAPPPRRRRKSRCMSGGAPIAHGGPQRLPARAAPSLVRALRDARGSPPWTPGTILWRLDRPRHSYTTCIHVGGVDRRPSRLGHFGQPLSVITITGFGDQNQPEWLITFTGIRNKAEQQFGSGGVQGIQAQGERLEFVRPTPSGGTVKHRVRITTKWRRRRWLGVTKATRAMKEMLAMWGDPEAATECWQTVLIFLSSLKATSLPKGSLRPSGTIVHGQGTGMHG